MRRLLRLLVATPIALAVGLGAGAVEPDAPWAWPVDGARAILREYTAPPTPYGRGHRGIDVRAGPVLRAPADGVVRFAGVVVDRPVLTIDHGNGTLSSFEPVVATVEVGSTVVRGQQIGTVLDGHCAQPCVHVGVRIDGEYVSPLRFLGGVPPAVLLPTRDVAAGR